MKNTIIALSAVLLASPVFAATTHATDDTVAAANANANEAKQKLHEEQNGQKGQKAIHSGFSDKCALRKRLRC